MFTPRLELTKTLPFRGQKKEREMLFEIQMLPPINKLQTLAVTMEQAALIRGSGLSGNLP